MVNHLKQHLNRKNCAVIFLIKAYRLLEEYYSVTLCWFFLKITLRINIILRVNVCNTTMPTLICKN